MDGEVIGVNTAIISPTGGSIGIGFAVPSNSALQVVDQLKEFGETRRGWLGVHVQNVTGEIAASLGLKEPAGALVASITPDSPAAAAGLKTSDIITKFDGQTIDTMRSLPRAVAGTQIGKSVDLEVFRNGETVNLKAIVGRLPQDAEEEEVVEEEQAPEQGEETDEGEEEIAHEDLLGLSIAPLTEDLRTQYQIGQGVEGVVITQVDPQSAAAQKRVKPGDVIVEVTQERVSDPQEVLARVEEVKKSGRKSVLLLISDAKGGLRFVAVPVV
jgi:serine protease Do